MKTVTEGTNPRPIKTVQRDDCVLSLAQIDKLFHEFKWILLKKHVHRAFNQSKYAFINLSDV